MELNPGPASGQARPHHSFHVIDICRRTGALAESLEVLDSCRMCIANPAQIIEIASDRALVRYEPGGGVHLAEPVAIWFLDKAP